MPNYTVFFSINSDNKDKLVDQHTLVDQPLAVTPVIICGQLYSHTSHFVKLIELKDHTIIVNMYESIWLLVQS